jgi:O-antigen/teichoic acid export membrane protein
LSEGWLPAEHGTDNRDLRRRVARGLIWTLADSWGRQMLGLAIFVVLANLLFQADIGLVALAAVFINFAQIFIDQGLSDALVQRRLLERAHIDSAFWLSLGIGAGLTVAGVLLATPIAALLDEPALEPILQVLSLSFLLYALSSVQTAILRRELNFRSLAIRSLLATIGGGVVGIGMAYLGYGPWALVGQALTQAALTAVTLWAVSPWRPGLRFSTRHFGELFRFSRNVVGSDIVTFFSRNTDNFLVGAVLGTFALGIYAVGFRILEATGALLIGVARRIAFPALSRLQHDAERMKRAFFRLTRLSGLIIIPGYVGMALVAQELVVVFFGQRWADSAPVAAILFLSGPVIALNSFGNVLLNASGHPGVVFRFRLITMVANVVGFFVAVFVFANVLAVAAAFTLRSYLLLPLAVYWQRRYAGIPMLEYARQMSGIALATGVMAGAVVAVKLFMGDDLGPATLLAAEVIVGVVAFGLALLIVDRPVVSEMLDVAGQAAPRLARGGRRRAKEGEAEAIEADIAAEADAGAGSTTSLGGADERETL